MFGVAPLAPALIADDPLGFLSAEHARQMVLLAHLDRLARGPAARGARAMADAVLRWLRDEMPLHIADEERSLLPRLAPHDRRGALARVRDEHERDRRLALDVAAGLAALVDGDAPGPRFAEAAGEFARLHRAHLEFEERAVMPLARQSLGAAERAALSQEIAARRGAARKVA